MKLVIALLLVALTVLSVQSYPYPPKPVHLNPQQQPSQYPYYVPPTPQQQPPPNHRMGGMFRPLFAYFQQFMALFREFLMSQQNPTVSTPEPTNTTTTTAAPVGTCDLGEYECVPVSLCEHVSEIQSFTCTNPQHVCCDN